MRQWVEARGGIDADRAAQERAQRIADRLTTDRPELRVRTSVLATDSVSAFSWPNRRVFLTRGLLRLLNDDELTAAIAHEEGHLLDDKNVRASFGLRGCANGLDTEARADQLGADLLEVQGFRRVLMAAMLRKVASTPALPPMCREALWHRVQSLEATSSVRVEAAAPGPSIAR